MKARAAWILPLVVAASVAALGLVQGAPSRVWFYAVVALASKSLALIGGLVAAFAFSRGDYLRRAWLFVAFGYLPLVLKDLLPGGGPWLEATSATWGAARALLAVLGNALSVVGLWYLARTSRVAGLEPPGSPLARRALLLAGAFVALALVMPGMRSDLHDVHANDISSLSNVAGDVGDVISFMLIAPVLLTAIALRGGRLVWPWILLTLGNVGWLVFDGPAALAALTGGMTPVLRAVAEGARTAACLYYAGAGLAQRWAMSEPA
jgi:hypothetical protein